MVVRYEHDQLQAVSAYTWVCRALFYCYSSFVGFILTIRAIQLLLLPLQLEDGDIICFQKLPQVGNSEQCRYPDVPSFLEYVHNRQVFCEL